MRGDKLSQRDVEDLNSKQIEEERTLRKSGSRRSKALLPVVRLPGPLLPVVKDVPDTIAGHPLGGSRRWHAL
eukprot:7249982-Karenia_brevis.AAC.1